MPNKALYAHDAKLHKNIGYTFPFNNFKHLSLYLFLIVMEYKKRVNFELGLKKYMYHELAHDVLNIDDLSDLPSNNGRLMYPYINTYEITHMDQFMEASHELFDSL